MLIYHRNRLRAAVAIRAIEIEGVTLCLQKVHLNVVPPLIGCGCVISHTVTVSLLPVLFWDKRCATLE
jgi:hypothetical protein